eukprot:6331877-Alexandrium_andersonii.AAC.1
MTGILLGNSRDHFEVLRAFRWGPGSPRLALAGLLKVMANVWVRLVRHFACWPWPLANIVNPSVERARKTS